MKTPRVKEMLIEYDRAGINGVFRYLNQSDMIIDPNSWAAKILRDITAKHIYTAMNEIELVKMNFKIEKNAESDSEPER